MKTKSAFKKSLIAAAVAGASFSMPMTAAAEISATLDIASQYIFRGIVEEQGSAAVSGSIDYEHDSGLYAGFWTGSLPSGIETNYYAGFASEAGDFSYDVGVLHYRFPPASQSGQDGFLTEAYVSVGYMGFEAAAFIGVDKTNLDTGGGRSGADDNKDNYFTLGYGYEQFGAVVGFADFDADDSNYTHLDLTYEVLPGLTFMASQILDADDGALSRAGEPLVKGTQFVVSYSFTF